MRSAFLLFLLSLLFVSAFCQDDSVAQSEAQQQQQQQQQVQFTHSPYADTTFIFPDVNSTQGTSITFYYLK